MTTHQLKTWPEYFELVDKDIKTFEVRTDDRGFQVGDILVLQEWDPNSKEYTGRSLQRRITYILRDWPGLSPNTCCMAIK